MPYKSEKIRLEGTKYDRRRKLSEEQKEEIRMFRKLYNISYNKLAAKYNVSKRLIIFICNPDIEKRNKERHKELRKDGRYYDHEKHNKSIKEMRRYKQELYLKKEIEL